MDKNEDEIFVFSMGEVADGALDDLLDDAEKRTCDSCRKGFLSQEYLNEEKLCADCQALIQEMFDEMGWSEPKEGEEKTNHEV